MNKLKIRILILIVFTASVLTAYTQETNHKDSRALVIGELVGRVDIREMHIKTRLGRFPVFSGGSAKPFRVTRQTETELEMRFSSVGIDPKNPNRLIYKFYETERALLSALILDKVDYAILESEKSALEVEKSNPHFLPLPTLPMPNTVKLICYNHRKPNLRSKKVRAALAYAIDKNHIIKKILGAKANPAYGPFDETSRYYNSGMESYRHRPKKAIQLLKESGWRDTNGDKILDKNNTPFRIDFYYRKGIGLDEEITRRIKINLIGVGVEINPKPMTQSKINDALRTGDFDAILLEYTFEDNLSSLEEFFSVNGTKNYMTYRNNVIEKLLKLYKRTDDRNRRMTLIKSMQGEINRDQPVNFLYFRWWTINLINRDKFGNYRDLEIIKGSIRPFDEWILKIQNEH